MDEYSDRENDISLPGVRSRKLNFVTYNEHMTNYERAYERARIEQRFSEMNRQIEKLTSWFDHLLRKYPLVKATRMTVTPNDLGRQVI